jgi:ankyrin repeat protein
VSELAEVLAIDFEHAEGIAKLNASWRWEDQEQALLSSCSSLISIVDDSDNHHRYQNSRVVQFSHFSVKEFLTSPRLATPNRDVSYYRINLEPAHTIMAQACLGILLQSDDRVEHTGAENKSLLVGYAAEYWVTHAQFKNVSSNVRQTMESLFDEDKPYFAAWLKLHDMDSGPRPNSTFFWFSPYPKSPAGPLYYAALCGFQDIVQHLVVKNPLQVNANGGYYVTPAIAALAGKHFKLAHLLHRHGSSADPRGHYRRTPLHSSASYGYVEMMKVLLEYHPDINARNSAGDTPLQEAVSSGRHEAIQLLFEYGANPNIPDNRGVFPLYLASKRGNSTVVRLLLDHGADVDAVDKSGRTALQLALADGHDEIVTLLSARGTDGSSSC